MARSAVLSIRLSHFRSWQGVSLAPGGESVALSGPNGAGKTNLLEAVSLLVPGRGLRRAGAEELIRRPERLGWRIAALIATPEGEVEVVTGTDDADNPRRMVEIDGKQVPQTRLAELLRQVWLTPAMDRLWIEGAAERRRFLDRMTMGFFPAHAEASATWERLMRERNRLLRAPRPDPAWLDGLEQQMARAGARIARARTQALDRLIAAQEAPETAQSLFPRARLAILGDMEVRFTDAIRAGSDLDALEGHEAASLAQALVRGRARDAQAGRTLDGPHRSDLEAIYAAKEMEARACSTGEQKALLISLALANARALALATGAAPVLLLDEVAAHLDADRRRALHAEIDAMGAQAWMTATGPELFEGLGPARRFAVIPGADGTSRLEAA